MSFPVKNWQDQPSTATPITAAALQDLETRLATYTDTAVPIGAITPYSGTGDPTGSNVSGTWVIADGRLVDRTTFTTFYSRTGHAYNGGVDPGNNKVRIPDKRGKSSRGAINMGTGASTNDNAHSQGIIGASGGEVNHTTLSTEMPSHNHGGLTGTANTGNQSNDHTHNGTTGGHSADHSHSGTTGGMNQNNPHNHGLAVSGANIGVTAGDGSNSRSGTILTDSTDINHTHTFGTGGTSNNHNHDFISQGVSAGHTHNVPGLSITSAGSSSPHNNLDPFETDSYIVRIG